MVTNVPPTNLLPFINFLERHGYEIKVRNPRFIPGSLYETEYRPGINIQHVVDHFRDSQEVMGFDKKMISDGYHTFGELYAHRYALFIALCKALNTYPQYTSAITLVSVWRSKLHDDGTMFNDSFIMGFNFVDVAPITYHLPMRLWALTDFLDTLEKAPPWDGHTSNDVLERLTLLISKIE